MLYYRGYKLNIARGHSYEQKANSLLDEEYIKFLVNAADYNPQLRVTLRS